eukprot:403360400
MEVNLMQQNSLSNPIKDSTIYKILTWQNKKQTLKYLAFVQIFFYLYIQRNNSLAFILSRFCVMYLLKKLIFSGRNKSKNDKEQSQIQDGKNEDQSQNDNEVISEEIYQKYHSDERKAQIYIQSCIIDVLIADGKISRRQTYALYNCIEFVCYTQNSGRLLAFRRAKTIRLIIKILENNKLSQITNKYDQQQNTETLRIAKKMRFKQQHLREGKFTIYQSQIWQFRIPKQSDDSNPNKNNNEQNSQRGGTRQVDIERHLLQSVNEKNQERIRSKARGNNTKTNEQSGLTFIDEKRLKKEKKQHKKDKKRKDKKKKDKKRRHQSESSEEENLDDLKFLDRLKKRDKKKKRKHSSSESESDDEDQVGPQIPDNFYEEQKLKEEELLKAGIIQSSLLTSYKRPRKQKIPDQLHPSDEKKLLTEASIKEQQKKETIIRAEMKKILEDQKKLRELQQQQHMMNMGFQ